MCRPPPVRRYKSVSTSSSSSSSSCSGSEDSEHERQRRERTASELAKSSFFRPLQNGIGYEANKKIMALKNRLPVLLQEPTRETTREKYHTRTDEAIHSYFCKCIKTDVFFCLFVVVVFCRRSLLWPRNRSELICLCAWSCIKKGHTSWQLHCNFKAAPQQQRLTLTSWEKDWMNEYWKTWCVMSCTQYSNSQFCRPEVSQAATYFVE